jgi:hypothetical protein
VGALASALSPSGVAALGALGALGVLGVLGVLAPDSLSDSAADGPSTARTGMSSLPEPDSPSGAAFCSARPTPDAAAVSFSTRGCPGMSSISAQPAPPRQRAAMLRAVRARREHDVSLLRGEIVTLMPSFLDVSNALASEGDP